MNRSGVLVYLKIAMFSIAVQLVAIVVGIFSAGAGHGSYVAAKLLFPYTLLAGGMEGPIPDSFVTLACVQYLLYGLIWAMAIKYKKVAPVISILAAVHVGAVLLVFILFSPSVFGHSAYALGTTAPTLV